MSARVLDLPRGFRDDGPVALAVAPLGARVPLPGPVLVLLGLAPLVAVAAFGGTDVSLPVVGLVLAWAVLAASAAGGRPADRTEWVEPPLVRMTEWIALIWIAGLEGSAGYPAAFALLAALAFRAYDFPYRTRHQGRMPAPWVGALAGGWELRIAVAYGLLVIGALPTGYYVAAVVLGLAFAGEAAASWIAFGRGDRPDRYEDEEDEEL